MEDGETTSKDAGCHGMPSLVEHLSYVCMRNLWLVPFGHAFFLGVVKDLFLALLTPESQGTAQDSGRFRGLPPDLRLTGEALEQLCTIAQNNGINPAVTAESALQAAPARVSFMQEKFNAVCPMLPQDLPRL